MGWLLAYLIRCSFCHVVDCSAELLRHLYQEILSEDDAKILGRIVADWKEGGGMLIMGPKGSRKRELMAGYLLLIASECVSNAEIPRRYLPLGYDALRDRLETGLWELKQAQ